MIEAYTKYKDTRFEFCDTADRMRMGGDDYRDYRIVTLVDPYHNADPRILVRIVAWNVAPTTKRPLLVVRVRLWNHDTDLPDVDLAPHRSFIAGVLPAYAYADWLDEIGLNIPREATDLLRGW